MRGGKFEEGGKPVPDGAQRKTERQYKSAVVRCMKSLGTYRPEFARMAQRVAAMYVKRDEIEQQFAENGGRIMIEYTNKNGVTNLVKNPLWVALNEMNSNLLIYERELGLTPAGLKKLNDAAMKQPQKSALGAALEALAK